jgi:hypothetical protein
MVSETTLMSETPRAFAASLNHFISAICSSRVKALSLNSPSAHFAATASMSVGPDAPEAHPVTSKTAAADMAKPEIVPFRTFLFNIFTFRIAVEEEANLVSSTLLELEDTFKPQNDE